MYLERAEIPLSKNVCILIRIKHTKKSLQFPIGVNFAIIGRVLLCDQHRDVIRVDNSLHQGNSGTHIHFLDKERQHVEYKQDIINPEQAIEYVEKYLRARYEWLIEGENDASGN